MLFNSPIFLFLFLPLTWLLFFGLARWGYPRWSWRCLLGASWIFYGWQVPEYLPLLLGTTALNFFLGERIRQARERGLSGRGWLIFGVVLNLAVLAYFKYSLFLYGPLQRTFGIHAWTGYLLLPLGISFHTFQQIAWLVDTSRDKSHRCSIGDYFLFVCFFPQLIAGPIVRHDEMLGQFKTPEVLRPQRLHLQQGLTLILLGLFKKMVLADSCAPVVDRHFTAVQAGIPPTFFEAWGTALSYAFQIYFDFSAYSDLAIGLALLFNLRLPLNFDSPYRATSLIEFWRRWHITLSRFLRDYLYIPLGGSRGGSARTALNLFLTMTLAGVWHGAGWNFVLWGALHGTMLIINHAWRRVPDVFPAGRIFGILRAVLGGALTMTVVVFAWVLFRSPNLTVTWDLWRGMVGARGIAWVVPNPAEPGVLLAWLKTWGWSIRPPSLDFYFAGGADVLFLSFLTAIVLFLPNSETWTGTRYFNSEKPARPFPWRWEPGFTSGLFLGILGFIIALNFFKPQVLRFIYFNF